MGGADCRTASDPRFGPPRSWGTVAPASGAPRMTDGPALIARPLTGERTYQFGADILEAIVAHCGARNDMLLQLKVPASCAIEIVRDPPPAGADLCGSFRHGIAGRVEQVWLRLRPDLPIAEREATDDADVTAQARFEGDRADLPAGGPGTFLQRAVHLAVALAMREYPKDYWRMPEIACERIPPDDAAVSVILRHRVGGRFWKMEFGADGSRCGTLILSRVMAPKVQV